MTAFGSTRNIIYFKTSPSESTSFAYPLIRRSEPIYDKLIYQSPLSGQRNAFIRGYHWLVEIDLQIFLFASDTSRRTQVDKWLPWIGDSDFRLQLWEDGNIIEKVNGTDAYFTLEEATPFYWNQRRTKDLIRLLFISNSYVQIDLSHP